MRLVSYGEKGEERPGLVLDGVVVDLVDGLTKLGHPERPTSLRAFLNLANWRELGHHVEESADSLATKSLDEVRLGAPIPEPSKILVAGANTHSHLAEAAPFTEGTAPKEPMILAKASSAVCGPEDPLVYPGRTKKLDYEVELGVIIGVAVRHVSVENALGAVAGYTVINDVSARDVQLAEQEQNTFYRAHFLGKSFDTFCPSGPWLTTIDEVPEIAGLRLRSWVNGDLRQDSTVDDLYFGVPELISYISSIMTLLPGDLICTGSPAGVAAFMDPPGYLSIGDLSVCEVEGIGRLRNRVIEESAS